MDDVVDLAHQVFEGVAGLEAGRDCCLRVDLSDRMVADVAAPNLALEQILPGRKEQVSFGPHI